MENDTEAAQLLELAAKADAGVDIDSQANTEPQADEVTPVESDASATDSSESKAKDAIDDDAGSLKDGDKSKGLDKAQDKQDQTKESKKSEPSKFAKELERKQKTWQQINAEREAIKAEREALKREQEKWQSERKQTVTNDIDSFRDAKNLSAKDYEDAAKSFEADGEVEKAKLARDKANELRKSAQEHFQNVEAEKYKARWVKNYEELSQADAWLKDESNPLTQRTAQILQQYEFLQRDPDGLRHAVALTKLEDQASKSKALETENQSLKERLSKLEKKTAIGKGTPTGTLKSSEKSFDKMTLEEQRAYLQQRAAEVDREL